MLKSKLLLKLMLLILLQICRLISIYNDMYTVCNNDTPQLTGQAD